jgi:transcriptional regulator, PadR family
MPEKAIYTLTDTGEKEFEKLMLDISSKPIHIFLDFNAVIVNINNLSPDKQKKCLSDIKNNIEILKAYLEDNINSKEQKPEIPTAGMAVLQQQLILVQAIENWIATLPNVF